MKKTFVLLLVLLLALCLFAGCDARNGKVTNSPGVTLTPGNTPGHTPVVTDVPSPTATHMPENGGTHGSGAAPDTGTSPTGEPTDTAAPSADTTAGFVF